ncbi:transglutaminase-like domain-containing protein [Comamonas badia]|uniref:transglutaminase-like domain-containing protein n=1 Tax=Comamonas badia TaxID=265291 RepID=UPI00040FED6E|nr:transglutaminase family protein [Comamonas badia]
MQHDTPRPEHLLPTAAINSDHPAVQTFAREHARGNDDRERAVALNLAVRDGFRYDPYRIELSLAGLCASSVLEKGYGWCVPKAVLLAAAARAVGIPSRLGFADVRNHLSTERMRATMRTDTFYWHGYTELWINGGWRKATPAFNIELCERFGLLPLDFDGEHDSIYHEFDKAGHRHMEYVHQRGSFDDLPLDTLRADFERFYPEWPQMQSADFEHEVRQETRK